MNSHLPLYSNAKRFYSSREGILLGGVDNTKNVCYVYMFLWLLNRQKFINASDISGETHFTPNITLEPEVRKLPFAISKTYLHFEFE